MGYIVLIVVAILLIPLIYVVFSSRPTKNAQGQIPVGKPVSVTEPAADEPTPDASDLQKNTAKAQRHTPAA